MSSHKWLQVQNKGGSVAVSAGGGGQGRTSEWPTCAHQLSSSIGVGNQRLPLVMT